MKSTPKMQAGKKPVAKKKKGTWHDPAADKFPTATEAVRSLHAQGDRINLGCDGIQTPATIETLPELNAFSIHLPQMDMSKQAGMFLLSCMRKRTPLVVVSVRRVSDGATNITFATPESAEVIRQKAKKALEEVL